VASAVSGALVRLTAAAARVRAVTSSSAAVGAALREWNGVSAVGAELARHPALAGRARAAAAAAAPSGVLGPAQAPAAAAAGARQWRDRRRFAAEEAAAVDAVTGANGYARVLQTMVAHAMGGTGLAAATAAAAAAGPEASDGTGATGGVRRSPAPSPTAAGSSSTGFAAVAGAAAAARPPTASGARFDANVSQTGLMSPLQARLVQLSRG
jgi:hypothetical protein